MKILLIIFITLIIFFKVKEIVISNKNYNVISNLKVEFN
jgi:hypothetical protein